MKNVCTSHHLFALLTICLFLPQAGIAAEGLQVTILDTTIGEDLRPEVRFTLKDNEGNPLRLEAVSIRGFILARLDVIDPEKDRSVYHSYTTRTQTVPEGFPNAGNSAEQAAYDSGGEFFQNSPGEYTYAFGATLPPDFDRTSTHTVSAQIERTVNEKRFVANPVFHFVPNGDEVTQLRRVVTTQDCNSCHTNLGLHGGGRKEMTLCLTCHTPQTTDTDTGNTLDFRVLIHKIHRGEDLPSVQNGEPFQIVGYRQGVHDYSDVRFPMDIRNCHVCHTGEQGDVYLKAPNRVACGACHDDVNFETGVGHGPGIPQLNDNSCTECHPTQGEEFGLSITGAHTIPFKSNQLKGLNAEIVEVLNTAPGQNPIVRFNLTENDGTVVEPAALSPLAITYAGPTDEYTQFVRESPGDAVVREGDTFSYTFNEPFPADASGTYAFSIEARRTVTLNQTPEGDEALEVTEAAVNPFVMVSLNDAPLQSRRQIVSLDKCNVCHDKLSLHGDLRNQIDYCVMCHNPNQTDIGRRPEGVPGSENVSFSYMIHKIHTGEELDGEFTVFGFGNRPHDFTEVKFPGERKECSICHIEEVPDLPLPDFVLPLSFLNEANESVTVPPMTASCTSCHDMKETLAHAQLNTTASGIESCSVCHKEDRIAGIVKAHARDVFLNVVERRASDPTSIPKWSFHE